MWYCPYNDGMVYESCGKHGAQCAMRTQAPEKGRK